MMYRVYAIYNGYVRDVYTGVPIWGPETMFRSFYRILAWNTQRVSNRRTAIYWLCSE